MTGRNIKRAGESFIDSPNLEYVDFKVQLAARTRSQVKYARVVRFEIVSPDSRQ